MRNFLLVAFVSVLSLVSTRSIQAAQLLVEPYIGIVDGEYDDKSSDDPNADYTYSGAGGGIRLGAIFLQRLMLGVVVDKAKVDAETKGSPSSKVEENFTNSGVFVGYHGSLMRVWLTYYSSAKMKYGEFSGANATLMNLLFKDAELEGSGFAIGLGVTPIRFIDIFAELHAYSYDKLTLANGASGSVTDASAAYFLLGVSIPIVLF